MVAKPQPSVEAPQPPIAKMLTSTDEVVSPRVQPTHLPSIARDMTPPQSFVPPAKLAPPPPAPAPKPTDDPVLADLESDLPTPVLTSYREPRQKKGRGSLAFLLFLMLAGGGFYAAWMYQPGFQQMVRPWIDRVVAALHVPGNVRNEEPAPAAPPAPAPQQQSPATNPAPAPSTQSPAPSTEASSGNTVPDAGPPAATTPSPVGSNETSSEPDDAAPPVDSSEPESVKGGAKKKVVAAVSSDTELPGEKSAVILSSQGAEKRLLHHVPPAYPAEARKERLEGTVVLKAVVSETGRVSGVRLVEGNPTLAAAAINAVKQWRYRPYLRNGKALTFQTIVLVEFQRH